MKTGRELIVDNFAGGGGASLGIRIGTGRGVDIAVNHDRLAIEMHEANHPETLHLCESVWKVDPLAATGGRPVGLAWFSPDCKHFSRAKGGKPVEKRIRGLAWVVVKWAKVVRPRVIILENVREFETWGPLGRDDRPDPKRMGLTYRRWLGNLRNLGYTIETRVLDAADYGAPTHRRRLFLIARCDGQPIVWPESTHGDPKKIGQGGLFGTKLQPWRTAAQCIDWSLPCPSIFERKRPLAEKTLRRIAMGLQRYVLANPRPFIVRCAHGESSASGPRWGSGVEDTGAPLPTVTASKDFALATPVLTHVNHGGERPPIDPAAPLPTVTGAHRGEIAIAAPVIARMNHGEKQWNGVDEPATTVTTQSNKQALVTAFLAGVGGRSGQSPPTSPEAPLGTTTAKADRAVATATLVGVGGADYAGKPRPVDAPKGAVMPNDRGAVAAAYLTQLRGSNRGKGDVTEPMPTATAGGTHVGEVRAFLIKYYGCGNGQRVDEPAHTLTARDRLGLVTIEGNDYQIVDIGLRMLTPRELARAQGFPDSYILTGTKSNQVAKIGNSVCPPIAAALAAANYGEGQRERVSA